MPKATHLVSNEAKNVPVADGLCISSNTDGVKQKANHGGVCCLNLDGLFQS